VSCNAALSLRDTKRSRTALYGLVLAPVYKGIQRYTRVYRGIKNITGVYNGFLMNTRVYRGIQEFTGAHKVVQDFRGVSMSLCGLP